MPMTCLRAGVLPVVVTGMRECFWLRIMLIALRRVVRSVRVWTWGKRSENLGHCRVVELENVLDELKLALLDGAFFVAFFDHEHEVGFAQKFVGGFLFGIGRGARLFFGSGSGPGRDACDDRAQDDSDRLEKVVEPGEGARGHRRDQAIGARTDDFGRDVAEHEHDGCRDEQPDQGAQGPVRAGPAR